ncbi:MAG: branched-chain amino acid ABC transporter permease [Thermoanaerobaculia bacterium]|nr:branched-chain amino acid ABC transporter permease [Thermoanaerobaculia bacterium]
MEAQTIPKPIIPRFPSLKFILRAVAVLIVAALFFVPNYVEDTYILHMMILIFINVVMGSSWNILGGYTGQYSVGHAAYFGAGAYTTMLLLQYKQVAPWYGVWVGAAAALVVAVIIGSICFRLRGPYFVLASIAVAEIFRVATLNLKDITNGAEGVLITEIPPLVIGGRLITDWASKVPFYYIGLVFALLIIGVTWLVRNSKLGYYFQAIREDQDAAHSLGIGLTFYKNVALAISAIFTSLAGSLYAVYVGFIDPSTVLGLDVSVQIVIICIIGGIGTITGPVVGAVLLVPLSEALRSNMITDLLIKVGIVGEETRMGLFLKEHLSQAHVLIYGILVVVTILYMPAGIVGFVRRMTARKARA